MKTAIVIGAGIGGIASSIRLAHLGYQVTVIEANAYPGGKLSTFTLEGYRFDAGPSLFTMPHYVTSLFDLVGENPADHFTYRRKEIACRYFWQDGTIFSAYSNTDKFIAAAAKTFQVETTRLKKYLERAKKKYRLTAPLFLERTLHKSSTLLSKKTLAALFHLPTYQLEETLHSANKKNFNNPKLVQLFDRYATYNGSNPYKTSGMMTLIQHLESEYGTFIPEEGMVAISKSLWELSKRQGVSYLLSTKVDQILVEHGVAKGVVVGEKIMAADVVVSNMDVFPTYRRLLPNEKAPEKILQQERSSSAVIFYWGIQQSFPDLELHNIFFSDDYKAEFEAIFSSYNIAADPTIYVNITSKDVPEDAPQNCENWFVMINTPADMGQDWEILVKELRAVVIDKLSRQLKCDLEALIVCEKVLTPPEIARSTQSHLGALYGASSNTVGSAFLRHPNFSKRIKNLYFCGGSVHPGGGIPLCLLSAKIVAELIEKETP